VGLVTEYPFWFILFCILLGAAYAGALYYRAKAEISPGLFRLLTFFRFLSVFLISFLLLSPLIRKQVKTVEKPVIAVGIDNSQSLVLGRDSVWYRDVYPKKLASFLDLLGKKFEVQPFTFGERVREGTDTGYYDKVTDISSFFIEMEKRLASRNVGAVIIASDGIYNQGLNPVYATGRIPWPVYSVALGDTVRKRDLLVKKTVYNRQAFLGDRFPAEILVEALKCNGERSVLKVTKGAETVAEIPFQVYGDRYSRKFSIQIEAKAKGLQRYTVTVTPVSDEFTPVNNRQEIFVEVLDERQKVLILYDAPHPDIAAITRALESGIRFEVKESELSKFTDPPDPYDLIILYQVPSVAGVQQLDRIMRSKASLLFMLGTRTDLFAFNNLQTGLAITSQKATFSESQPVVNSSFPLFTVEKDMQEAMKEYPPLVCPFGTYQSSPLSDIFLYQKIGNVTSQFPMAIFFRNGERKTGVIAGENIWRWRISEFIRKGNQDAFNELVSKIVMYLSVKGDKSLFRVKTGNTFLESEPVEFTAEVYNKSYELINEPEVSLVVSDENGRNYPFVMTKTGKDYFLNAGNFPAGDYTFEASVMIGKEKQVKKGIFMIARVNLEALNVVADHALLSRISAAHEGFMTVPDSLDNLARHLMERDDIASVSHSNKRYSDLAGNLWLFLAIIGLLAAEWGIRKRSGM
jgi:hypothetical protein